MAILTVGSGLQYTTIGAAIDASQDGDTIQVQAGTYQGLDNMGEIKHSIKLEAVGGRVTLEPDPAQPEVFQSKGMLLVDNPLTTEPSTVEIDGFDFKNATSSYADNAAGIRFQGNTHLILNNDGFFNNDEGILANGDPTKDSIRQDASSSSEPNDWVKELARSLQPLLRIASRICSLVRAHPATRPEAPRNKVGTARTRPFSRSRARSSTSRKLVLTRCSATARSRR